MKITIFMRENGGMIEYYMKDKTPFFIHVPPKREPGHQDIPDYRRQEAERAMYCVLSHLGYAVEFRSF